jgi:hypothetical protein
VIIRLPRILTSIGLIAALGLSALLTATARAEGTTQTVQRARDGTDGGQTVDLHAWLLIVRGHHSGTGAVQLSMRPSAPHGGATADSDGELLLFDLSGAFNGATAARVEKSGTYRLDVRASGSQVITFEQPEPQTHVPEDRHQFSGHGAQVPPILRWRGAACALC